MQGYSATGARRLLSPSLSLPSNSDSSSLMQIEGGEGSDFGDAIGTQRGLLQSGVELTYSIFPAKFNEETTELDANSKDDNGTVAAPGTGEASTEVTLGRAEGEVFDMVVLVSLAEKVTQRTSSLQNLTIGGFEVDTSSISTPEVVEATPETCVPVCKVRIQNTCTYMFS
jgi:hypothetical protein